MVERIYLELSGITIISRCCGDPYREWPHRLDPERPPNRCSRRVPPIP